VIRIGIAKILTQLKNNLEDIGDINIEEYLKYMKEE
jgi:hypothetical protein